MLTKMLFQHSTHQRRVAPIVSLLLLLSLLAGCDPSGGNGNNSSDPTPLNLADTELTLSFARTKRFHFEWQPVPGVTHYQLAENADGKSGFPVVVDNIAKDATQYDLTVPLFARTRARYQLLGCINQRCDLVGEARVAVEDIEQLVNSVGYFKGFLVEETDTTAGIKNVGAAVALSEDGTTLAVGAPLSAAPNVLEAGLVFIYRQNTDGIWQEEQRIAAENPDKGDRFGIAVSLSGNGQVLAVGAIGETSNTAFGANADEINATNASVIYNNDSGNAPGATYLFHFTEGGSWEFSAYLKGDEPGSNKQFGFAVSLNTDGKVLAVSERLGTKDENVKEEGKVYIYRYNSEENHWLDKTTDNDTTTVANLSTVTAVNGDAGDGFGTAISLNKDGTYLAVGASSEDNSNTAIVQQINGEPAELTIGQDNGLAENSGAAYLFAFNANQWQLQAYFKASNAGGKDINNFTGDSFGESISLSGDGNTLAVGASFEDTNASTIFQSGQFTGPDNNDLPNSGAVYLFSRPNANGAWVQQVMFKASNAYRTARFGSSVSLSQSGDRLAVGSANEDSFSVGIKEQAPSNEDLEDSGAAYIFQRDNSNIWQETVYIKASSPSKSDNFGDAIALSADGQTLAVGAPDEDEDATGINQGPNDIPGDPPTDSNFGAVYLY